MRCPMWHKFPETSLSILDSAFESGGEKGGRLVGLAQAGAERLERLDEVSRVVLQVELAEPGRPP